MQTPTPGRVVRYVLTQHDTVDHAIDNASRFGAGDTVAAHVAHVHDDNETCDLRIVGASDQPFPLRVDVAPDQGAHPDYGTWHWPPR